VIRVRPVLALSFVGCILLLGCGDDTPSKPKNPVVVTPPAPHELLPGVVMGTGTLTGSIYSLAVGDLSGDSIADVAVGGEGDEVWVGFGSQAGPQAGTVVHAGVHAAALAVGDFDDDGFGDLIAAGDAAVTMLRGSAGGIASSAETLLTFPDTMHAATLRVADLTSDGRDDIVLTTYWPQRVAFDLYLPRYVGTVIRYNGTTPLGLMVAPPEVADVNGDGRADLAVLEKFGYSVSVHFGSGNGTFSQILSQYLSGQPTTVSLMDLDGDGDDEVVVVHFSGRPGVGTLEWQPGSLGAEAMVPGSDPGLRSAFGDLNGDGKPDLASAAYQATALSILLGNGAGGLVVGDPVSAGEEIEEIAAGDVDGDGRVDLITRGAGAGTVRLIRSAPAVAVARR
jgi:hypothetical protein